MAGMEVPVLNKCCFIFELKTGCLVLGIINSILSFLGVIILITLAVDIKEESSVDGEGSTSAYTFVILLVILQIVKFLMEVMFIYAVRKEKRGLIKKYCIFCIAFLGMFIISFLVTMFHLSAGHIFSQLFFFAENIYFLVVIRSFLLTMNEDSVP